MALTAALWVAACSSPGAADRGSQQEHGATTVRESRALVIAIRFEPNDLSPKTITRGGSDAVKRPVNAAIALVDANGAPMPYLAEALPPLHSEAWQVFPDGRMLTTHRLRPGLRWHDGEALTAEDFVFAWRVYSAAGLGLFNPKPQDQMQEVNAPDAGTILIWWRSPYPGAGLLLGTEESDLPPLPRHILEAPFRSYLQDPTTRDAFLNHGYWTSDYVGAGPFRLQRWDPGTAIELAAFDAHALGRPKVDRLSLRLMADENAVLTHLLAGTVHVAIPLTLRFEHAQVLKREWSASSEGAVLLASGPLVTNIVQFRPELLKEPALLDVRVRKALAYTVDRQALQDSIFDGLGRVPNSFVPPEEPYFLAVEQAVTKYRYDPRLGEQLMAEAAFAKDREGLYANPAGQRFSPDFQVFGGTVFERAQAILVDTWARAGLRVQPSVLPPGQVRDAEALAVFPGIATGVGRGPTSYLPSFAGEQIGSRANAWLGRNRGGWSSMEYDRLWSAFHSTLDASERERQVAEMARIVSEQLPAFPLYHNFDVMAHLSRVSGPTVEAGNTTRFWNVHDWELR